MRINTKGYFDITMPRKALTYIYIDTALCAPCNKRVPQIMQFMSGAKPLKSTAYNTFFVRKYKFAVGALFPLSDEQLFYMGEHIQTAQG